MTQNKTMKVREIYNYIIMKLRPNKRFSYRNYWLKNTRAYKYIKCFFFGNNAEQFQALAIQKILVIRKGDPLQITLPIVKARCDII
jgi:hypothetical protein